MGRLLRWLALAVASLLAIAVALVAFVSTETGFRVLLRPLLEARGIEVERGDIGLGGTLEASGVRWSGGSLETLALDFAPLSLLPGRRPRVHSLQVEALSLDLTAADPAEEAKAEILEDEDAPFFIPPLEVDHAAISVVSLRQLDPAGEVLWQIGPAELSVEDWRPGHDEGDVEIRLDFALPRTEPARSGTLALSAHLQVPASPNEPHGFAKSQLDVTLEPDQLALHAEPEGHVGEHIELRGPLSLTRADRPLLEDGQLELALRDDANELALKVGRAPLRALLATLGRRPPNQAVAAMALALDARIRTEPDSGRIHVERFDLEQRAPGARPVRLSAQGSILPGAEPELELDLQARGADGGKGSARVELAAGELDLKIVSLDLTPLAEPWLQADGDETAEAEPEAEPARRVARVEIGALRFRQLLVRDARATLEQQGETLRLDIPAARIGEGKLAATLDRGLAEGRRSLAWKVDAEQLDLEEIFRSLDPDSEGKLAGTLDLSSDVSSDVAADADPLDALEGALRFKLRDAEAQGLPFQQFMASKLAVNGLASLAFTGAEGDIPIRKGRAIFEDFYIDGNAANFKLRGELSARDIDLSVNPRLGPRLASELTPRFTGALFETASGALALPVAFQFKGPWSDTQYLMLPAPPSLVGDVLGGSAEAIQSAGRFLLGGGDDPDAEAAPPLANDPDAEAAPPLANDPDAEAAPPLANDPDAEAGPSGEAPGAEAQPPVASE